MGGLQRKTAGICHLLALFVCIPLELCFAAREQDAVIYPATQQQVITDWGYDIKQPGKAKGLTPVFSQTIFISDKFTCLRVPIYAYAAHPKQGQVVDSEYTDCISAIKNAQAAQSGVKLFTSLKLEGEETFPSWVKGANGVLAAPYARLIADYLKFMKEHGIQFHILGIDNEMEYNKGDITPEKHKNIVDNLKSLGKAEGFSVPPVIGPETYTPAPQWVTDLVNGGWGNRLDMAGTHYYPKWRPLNKLKSLCQAAQNRPVWNSEVHWDKDTTTTLIDEAEKALAAVFDCFDEGVSGMVWWAYTRNGVKGGIEKELVASTVGSRPIDINDFDGRDVTFGELITRAFSQGNDISVWAINNRSSALNSYGFKISGQTFSSPVTFIQWKADSATEGKAAQTSSNRFELTLPARTITCFRFKLDNVQINPFNPANNIKQPNQIIMIKRTGNRIFAVMPQSGDYQITIYDFRGKKTGSINLLHTRDADLSSGMRSGGVYIVRIKDSAGQVVQSVKVIQ